jgi:hypothetical protein
MISHHVVQSLQTILDGSGQTSPKDDGDANASPNDDVQSHSPPPGVDE